MRFLITVSDQCWGGKHAYMYNVAEALREAGHSVWLCCEEKGKFQQRAVRDQQNTLSVPNFTDISEQTLDLIKQTIKEKEIDIVMATGRRDYLVVYYAVSQVKRDVAIIAVRGSGFPIKVTEDYRRALAKTDAIILATNQQIEQQFHELLLDGTLTRNHFVEFRTTVNTSLFSPRPPEEKILREFSIRENQKVIVSVARLSWEKGHEVLLKAFAKLAPHYSDLILMLVGDGELRDSLLQCAADMNIAERLILSGHREDIPEILSVSFAHVLASICEETGAISLQEAMAMGVPVVASRRGIIPDYVIHNETGLLFESGNVDELAACLLQLIQNEKLVKKLRENARREILERFDESHQKRRLVAFFEDFARRRFG